MPNLQLLRRQHIFVHRLMDIQLTVEWYSALPKQCCLALFSNEISCTQEDLTIILTKIEGSWSTNFNFIIHFSCGINCSLWLGGYTSRMLLPLVQNFSCLRLFLKTNICKRIPWQKRKVHLGCKCIICSFLKYY